MTSMIEPLLMRNEELFAFSELAKNELNRTHPSTLMRWRTRGIQGIRLEAVRVGGHWMTSRQAIQRFVSAITQQKERNKVAITGFAEKLELESEGL
jgi:hypothetical protein